MRVAGIDLSTRYIDLVLICQDTGRLDWHRYPLGDGIDAWERTRTVRLVMPARTSTLYEDVLAFGLEDPAGHHGVLPLIRIQGALLSCLPAHTLVHPYRPARWKHLAGLPGHASKEQVRARSLELGAPEWHPQDAHDAHLVARAMVADLDAQEKAA